MGRYSTLKPDGFVETTGLYGELTRGETVCCVHCRHHWIVEPGSGKRRGWCMPCGGYTCGRVECDACVPYEQRLENIEAGLPELTPRAALVASPGFLLSSG